MRLKKFRPITRATAGQALVEYALILVMVAILFAVTLAATGPAIGNVFSNMIYNIIGDNPTDPIAQGPGQSDNFWATVEWLQDHQPEEHANVLNNPLPPAATATSGPTPTSTPITPSPVPPNTATNTQQPTPQDFGKVAPWLDTMDHPEWWRIDSSVWIGSDQFFGKYYANSTMSGDPAKELWHVELGLQHPHTSEINFNWPSGSGPITDGFTTNNWSVGWTRQVWFAGTDPKEIRFTLTTLGAQDGARLWLYEKGSSYTPENECSSVASGGGVTGSHAVYGDGASPSGSATDCLVIDDWSDNSSGLSVTRTLQPETFYIIQVDYYKRNGDAGVSLDIEGTSTGNRDDANLAGGQAKCAWYHANTTKSNSSAYIWEDSRDTNFPDNHVCYLEFRGYIEFSALVNPKLIFWDVWDLGDANTEVWLDVAEYSPPPAVLSWTKIPLRTNSTNYAWTRNVIDLSSYVSGYSKKQLALRFGIRANNGAAPRRWYVDDLEVRDFAEKSFGICAGTSQDTCGDYWNMENATFTQGNAAQRIDPQFVTTGRWALTGNHAIGNLAWDSGPSVRNPDGGPRIHYVAFNGTIDLSGNIPDFQGDDGVPVLSFQQAYQVKSGTQLEIQWTRDVPDTTPDVWNTLEVLVADPSGSGGATVTQATSTRIDVLLDDVPQFDTVPFRLRFAMIVQSTADETSNWQIDEILIHRFDAPRFSDYPFFDNAENGMKNWLPEGQWSTTNTDNHATEDCQTCGNSFTDSPNGNYIAETN